MSKKYRGSRPLIIRSERSLRAAKLAPLVALTIGGCLLSALPQRAAAQEQCRREEEGHQVAGHGASMQSCTALWTLGGSRPG